MKRRAALALALAAACDEGPAPAATDAAFGDVPAACEGPQRPGATCLLGVAGVVEDETGAALAGRNITLCGPACFYTTTDAGGRFVLPVGLFLDLAQYSLQVHARPSHASLFAPLPPPSAGRAAFPSSLRAPRYTDEGPALPDPARGGTVTAGDVTLSVPAGTAWEYDVEDVELGALGQRLRVAAVPADRAPAFARAAGLGAVWALAPFNLVVNRQRIGVRVGNRLGLAPGARVELVAMGNAVYDPPYNGGEAVVAARGRVSDDGRTIATDDGEGLAALTWFGVRGAR